MTTQIKAISVNRQSKEIEKLKEFYSLKIKELKVSKETIQALCQKRQIKVPNNPTNFNFILNSYQSSHTSHSQNVSVIKVNKKSGNVSANESLITTSNYTFTPNKEHSIFINGTKNIPPCIQFNNTNSDKEISTIEKKNDKLDISSINFNLNDT